MAEYKTIKVHASTHETLKKLAKKDSLTISEIVSNLVNASINWVKHAEDSGLVPTKATEKLGKYHKKNHWVFLALYYRAIGKISEDEFQRYISNLSFLIFCLGLDIVDLDQEIAGLSEDDVKIKSLEYQIKKLKLKKILEDK